jgi:hypothetical protein
LSNDTPDDRPPDVEVAIEPGSPNVFPNKPMGDSRNEVERPPMRYLDSYGFAFRSPDASSNILLVTVVQLIPIVGAMVVYGYQFEIIDALLRQPEATYPKFDVNRFMDYLKRGVWPFLVYVILNAIMAPLIVAFQMVIAFGGAALAQAGQSGANNGADIAPIVLILLGGVFFLGLMVLSLAMMFIMTPLMLGAGLSQDIGESFRIKWIKSFIAKVWKEELLTLLFLMVTGTIVALVGFAFCCIGVYPAIAVVMLAQAHLNFQLYKLYLDRGGEPIVRKNPFGA